MCRTHFEIYRDGRTKPIWGIDPPPNASEFWQPSLINMIRLAEIRISGQNKRSLPDTDIQLYRDGDDRRYTPGQLAQVVHLRKYPQNDPG